MKHYRPFCYRRNLKDFALTDYECIQTLDGLSSGANKFMFAATLATSLCLAQMSGFGTVEAAGLNAESDIVGLRTTMTRDQAKQFIQQQFGTTDFQPKIVKFGTPDYNVDVTLGFSADVTPKEEREVNQKRLDDVKKLVDQRRAQGCNSAMCMPLAPKLLKDVLDVYVDPNANGTAILALARHKEYAEGIDITYPVFVQTLADKFGSQPQLVDSFGFHYWVDIPVSANRNEVFECKGFADNVGDLPQQFPILMNGFGNNKIKLPKCGMLALARIEAFPKVGPTGIPSDFNTKYVRKLDMTLVNVRASYGALNAYAANFWTLANKAKQETLAKQSQNKPKL